MNVMVALREDATELPPGTRLLNGLYEIVEPLQQGGFALTYVARDSLERNVVIKECFPAGLCERSNGRVRAVSPAAEAQFVSLKLQFLREARGVATLKHPYVVAVHQVFEENNTAYMALDYVDGIDLISVLDDEPERLTPAFFEATLRETLKAVRHIHANGVLHRDIAPDNIRVDASDRITLIDFGAASARTANSALAAVSVPAVKDGYSPPEFYSFGQAHEFSSDLYSLAATFYHLITGDAPPDGLTRAKAISSGAADPYVPLASGEWNCGYHLLLTIDSALDVEREHRPQSADHWLKALDDAPKLRPARAKAPVVDPGLNEAVARLVRDVNDNLKANASASLGKLDAFLQKNKAAAPAATTQKQWVDIFGTPIGDLATWTKQEEPKLRSREIERKVVELFPEPQPEPELELTPGAQQVLPARKSLIVNLLSRCLSRRPDTCLT